MPGCSASGIRIDNDEASGIDTNLYVTLVPKRLGVGRRRIRRYTRIIEEVSGLGYEPHYLATKSREPRTENLEGEDQEYSRLPRRASFRRT